MFRNYLKTAFRNLLRFKVYSFINIAGLAVGLAVSILCLLFVKNELSFDKFNVKGDRIYRVITSWKRNGEFISHSNQPMPLGPALVSEFPEIKSAVRFFFGGEAIISYGGNNFKEVIKYTDPNIFSVFSFPLVEGNPSSALVQPNSIVLNEKTAKKIFGNENPISRFLKININGNTNNYEVTGVAKDIPDNSSIDFDILLPLTNRSGYGREVNDWTSFSGSTFILLSRFAQISDIHKGLPSFIDKYWGGFISQWQANGWIDKSANAFEIEFEPLSNVHFSEVMFGMERHGNPVYSYALSLIAFIILFIACVNYITLSLGQSMSRTKEVGVRKVLGAGRNNIMKQFWSESILLIAMAFPVSIFLVELLLPLFNQLSGKRFHLANIVSPNFIVILAGLIFLVGILAGSYPSIVLSKFQPVEVLKGKPRIGKGNILSKSLVVVQFGLAVFLIISSITVWYQIEFIRTKDLGYNGDQVIVIPDIGAQVIELLKNKLASYQGVINTTGTSATFGQGWNQKIFKYNGTTHETYLYRADGNYIPTLGLHLIEGRNFREGSITDSSQSVIVNEEFIKDLGWELPALNKTIPDWHWGEKNIVKLKIIGIVKDYNFLSLRDKIAPVMLTMDSDWDENGMMIKIHKENIPSTISYVRKVYDEILPDKPFEFSFLNSDVQKQYDEERKEGEIVSAASLLAILISCLGLFALVTLAVSSRTKEVGIRKVLGASIGNIITIISKDFLKLIAISNLIALPIGYYAGHTWLQDFAYRINMSPWIFVLAMAATFVISTLTIVFQVIKTAMANPAKSLRYE